MTTTLTQASQQWMSRPADERFTSIIEMQAFKGQLRDASTSKVISSRQLHLQPTGDSVHSLTVLDQSGYSSAPTHWSFGQLCSLASPGNSPASYFRETRMPAPVIAESYARKLVTG
jgi:hypothetical protein